MNPQLRQFGSTPIPPHQGAKFKWTPECQQAFDSNKTALFSALALALPDTGKPFILYLKEKGRVPRGVLTQTLGSWKRPVAYLSKKLDSVASGWPKCLRAITAAALLVKDADKISLGTETDYCGPTCAGKCHKATPRPVALKCSYYSLPEPFVEQRKNYY